MSNSIAAAKKRRAGIQPTTPQNTMNPSSLQDTNTVNNQKLTLPQVISIIDNRLINLETFMKETKENGFQTLQTIAEENIDVEINENESSEVIKIPIAEYVVEMDKKFELLVEEITTLKDIVLKLQSFTMEVNKTLMEDRIQILSDYKHIEIDDTVNTENIVLNIHDVSVSNNNNVITQDIQQ
jgi:hypothetical protein